MLKNVLLVGLGGALGSIVRYFISLLLAGKTFPFATFTVNILGSFAIGIFIAFSLKNNGFDNNWKLFLATGICGGFTTFSAFALENVQLLQSGKALTALSYIALSVILGIAATFLGFKIIATN